MSVKNEIIKRLFKHKSILIMMVLYIVFILSSGVYFLIVSKLRNALLTFVFLLFVPLVFYFERLFKVELSILVIFLSLFVASGAIIGACFDVYHLLPFFDDLLHTISGFLFSCLGYILIKVLLVKDNNKAFYSSLIFGSMFSLAIGLLWELLEYGINVIFGFDMLADTYINNFNSYLLSGTHDHYVSIFNISKTVVYYGDNNLLELNGYLDIGLFDTMNDMFVCFIGTLIFLLITFFNNLFFKKLNKIILPIVK